MLLEVVALAGDVGADLHRRSSAGRARPSAAPSSASSAWSCTRACRRPASAARRAAQASSSSPSALAALAHELVDSRYGNSSRGLTGRAHNKGRRGNATANPRRNGSEVRLRRVKRDGRGQAVRPPGYTWAAMLECSICRRPFDGRFKVMVPPSHEAFDSIECAPSGGDAPRPGRGGAGTRRPADAGRRAVGEPGRADPGDSAKRPGGARSDVCWCRARRRSQAVSAWPQPDPRQRSTSLPDRRFSPRTRTPSSPPCRLRRRRPRRPSTPATRPAARAPLPLAAKRPPDVRARKLVVGRRSRPLAGYAVTRNVVHTGRSTHGVLRSTSTNDAASSRGRFRLAGPPRSRKPTPVAKVVPNSGACDNRHAALDADVDPEAAAPSRSPGRTWTLPTPGPPTSGATSKPSNPAANSATRRLASADGTPPKGKKPEPPVMQAAAAASPLQQLHRRRRSAGRRPRRRQAAGR